MTFNIDDNNTPSIAAIQNLTDDEIIAVWALMLLRLEVKH